MVRAMIMTWQDKGAEFSIARLRIMKSAQMEGGLLGV
jgi:hypothetical protein